MNIAIEPIFVGNNECGCAMTVKDKDYATDTNFINEIQNALHNEQFTLAYQPQVEFRNGNLVGFEALIRWNSPVLGAIRPDVFIPIAEKSGQILEIGEWVIKQACADLDRIHAKGLKDCHMAINLSSVQLHEQDIVELTMSTLFERGLKPKDVHLELTETALIRNPLVAEQKIVALDDAGVEIWLDDFGTGYASLSMLRKFPIKGLKIDKSFIDGVATNDQDFTICSAIIAMAQRLGLGVVAEGIESEIQMQIMAQLGCNRAQGYMISKPESFDNVCLNWLGNFK